MRPQIHHVQRIGQGFLAVMAKPVAQWLDDEVAGIAAEGVDRLVSLLEPEEARELGLQREAAVCAAHGIEFIGYPFADRGVPVDMATFKVLTVTSFRQIEAGHSTVIHCRAGIGRSGLAAAAVLLHAGLGVTEAFAQVSAARRVSVPDTPEQEAWLRANARAIVAP